MNIQRIYTVRIVVWWNVYSYANIQRVYTIRIIVYIFRVVAMSSYLLSTIQNSNVMITKTYTTLYMLIHEYSESTHMNYWQ